MKIILVHNHYRQPGGEDVVFDQERQLLERAGHQVITYCRSNSQVESYSGTKGLTLLPRAIWAQETWKDFGDLLRRERPDLVHVHNTWVMISPSIYAACRKAGVPVVQTLHNYRLFCPAGTFFRDGRVCNECVEWGLSRSVMHGCYRQSRPTTAAVALMLAVHRAKGTWTRDIDCYITLCQFSRNVNVKAGLPPEKVFVKANFVHPDPGMCDEKDNYVLFIGRLSPEKRVNTILRAWSFLGNRIPLIVIGGGPERARLEKEAEHFGLTSVRFEGHLPRAQALAVLRRARFLIFSSEWYENFPVTIAESFACGVPVLCSRLGAMQEIVDDGRTGVHFAAGDAQDLAEKVKWAWNNPDRLRKMGEEARREYESKYTAETNYPVLMQIYRHALARHGSNGRH